MIESLPGLGLIRFLLIKQFPQTVYLVCGSFYFAEIPRKLLTNRSYKCRMYA